MTVSYHIDAGNTVAYIGQPRKQSSRAASVFNGGAIPQSPKFLVVSFLKERRQCTLMDPIRTWAVTWPPFSQCRGRGMVTFRCVDRGLMMGISANNSGPLPWFRSKKFFLNRTSLSSYRKSPTLISFSSKYGHSQHLVTSDHPKNFTKYNHIFSIQWPHPYLWDFIPGHSSNPRQIESLLALV